MIDGLSHLISLRKQNLRPVSVMLSIDVPYVPIKYEHELRCMELVAHGSVAKDDFRAFRNLSVLFYVPKWNDLAADCFEKIKQECEEITLLSPEYGQDIGFVWSRQYGMLDIGTIGWLEQYYEAKGRVCRSSEETEERIRLENESLAHLDNHPSEYKGEK